MIPSCRKQCANTIMMVRPVHFRLNEQTTVNNYYQRPIEDISATQIHANAQREFDNIVKKVRKKGVSVVVIESDEQYDTPDAIFSNNWVSFHEDGRAVLYPMYAGNRRQERRTDVFDILKTKCGFSMSTVEDLTYYEHYGYYLEGTGSMVLDRVNKLAYAALSMRTDKEVFYNFCKTFEYKPITFTANQTVGRNRQPIYHTNVMMCIADDFALICLDSIDDDDEKACLIDNIEKSGKEIMAITEDQVSQFVGNMLQVEANDGEKYMVMSSSAYHALASEQIAAIEAYCHMIHSPLNTIETLGGGSARCMMTEVFLPKKLMI